MTVDGSNNSVDGAVDGFADGRRLVGRDRRHDQHHFRHRRRRPHEPRDTGTPYYTISTFFDSFTGTLSNGDVTDPPSGGVPATTGSLRAVWRWADPDAGGSGISGGQCPRFSDASATTSAK